MENKKDLLEIPSEIKRGVGFKCASNVGEALEFALEKKPANSSKDKSWNKATK